MKFQENLSNGRRDADQETHLSSNKVPLIMTDRLEFVFKVKYPSFVKYPSEPCSACKTCMEIAGYEVSRKSVQWKLRYTQQDTSFSK